MKCKTLAMTYFGSSMKPFFKEGEELLCDIFEQPQSSSVLKEGEVYLSRDQQEWVFHRCVSVQGKLLLKGDWSPHVHEGESIWGRVQSARGSLWKTGVSRISMMNYNRPRWMRYTSKLILSFIALFIKRV